MRTDEHIHTDEPATIYRLNYTPPAFLIEKVDLGFDLDLLHTRVASRMVVRANPEAAQGVRAGAASALVLQGQELELHQIRINQTDLKRADYRLDDEKLTITAERLKKLGVKPGESFVLDIETSLCPQKNTSLMGLYGSQGNLYTQCEAEGFRKITYFPDRPDVMTVFTVMLRADQDRFPVLLSNGNLVESGELEGGRHYAKWEDPFRKPSYLFALVAGKLVCEEKVFRRANGRDALLQVWVQDGNLDKAGYAMESLVSSIQWDVNRYGLDLDLDRFMIVATSDFNMGAMENKGLNIFNAAYVLARPDTATDHDYSLIESIVGHEYFHNWTGNRITCRDWFQLSLKEGLTVFRDQEFSADMVGSESGRAVKRIEDVVALRERQFSEDSGPMAHPVRPESYEEINNFYTTTVYEKGAEVVRMYQTLVGRDGFRRGMDLYFERHDGQAVTCDDFRAAMADASQRDFSQFERWYSQSGTPVLTASGEYDQEQETYTLTLSQSCPATPGQKDKLPFHIPVAFGLLDKRGDDVPLVLQGQDGPSDSPTVVLELTQQSQQFVFKDVSERPVPSVLRQFSAPVRLEMALSEEDLALMFAHDSDAFNRWEAGQRLALNCLLRHVGILAERGVSDVGSAVKRLVKELHGDATAALLVKGFRKALQEPDLDPSYRVVLTQLPSEDTLANMVDVIDPLAILVAVRGLRQFAATRLITEWQQVYDSHLVSGPYRPVAPDVGMRALRNCALGYLLEADVNKALVLARQQYDEADNMTERMAALHGLVNYGSNTIVINDFYGRFRDDDLVINKWFGVQSSSRQARVETVQTLMNHPVFSITNPNRARSVLSTFFMRATEGFHAPDGSGYELWAATVIKMDAINPMVAARTSRILDRWKQYAPRYRDQMNAALKKVHAAPGLSRDTREIVSKALAE